MTTCIAIWKPDAAAIASDLRVTQGDRYNQLGRPKIKRIADWLVLGAAGGSRALRVLDEWKLSAKTSPKGREDARATLQKAADALWERMGWEPHDDAEDEFESPEVLCLTKWGVYSLSSGGTVWPYGGDIQVISIGSGGSFALGAAKVLLRNPDLTLEQVLTEAIEVASSIDPATGNGCVVFEVQAEGVVP